MTIITSIFVFSQLLQLCAAANKCFFPNGDPSADFPCDPTAKFSACCGSGIGSACLSNQLCRSGDGHIVRGSCTDKSWGPHCADYCLSAAAGGTDLISCSNVTKTDTSFCCDHTNGCCDTGAGRFDIFPSNPAVWATWRDASSSYVVVGTIFSSVPKSTSASTSTTKPSATGPKKTETPPAKSPDQSSGLSTGAKAGIGVGVGIGAIIIAAVAFLLLRRRRKPSEVQLNEENKSPASGVATSELEGQPKVYQELPAGQETARETPRAELP